MALRLKSTCPECNGEGWDSPCDCDPEGFHHCKGQGSCGTSPCEKCEGTGEVFVGLTAEAFAAALAKSGLRFISPSFIEALDIALEDIVEEPLSVEQVSTWIKWADEGDCEKVRLALSGARPGPRQALFESLLVHEMLLWKNRAKSLLRRVYDQGDEPTREIIRDSTLIEEVPDLSVRPLVDLSKMEWEDVERLVSDLQAVIAIKDEGLRKQSIVYDPPVQQKALERALNATPEMAQGLVEHLKQQVSELKNEAWSWESAYRHCNREGMILRKALHEKIDELEGRFPTSD